MTTTNNIPQSWGRYPIVKPRQVIPLFWRNELPDLSSFEKPILPFAYGRSYGDSCLNEDGIALDIRYLKRFIAFDERQGVLRCEAGVSLAEVLDLVVPRGWFLPVSPGTKFVSVGGASANDNMAKIITRQELLVVMSHVLNCCVLMVSACSALPISVVTCSAPLLAA